MKTSIHTMYYLPDFGSAPILMNELAVFLAGRGGRVEVVTTFPRERTGALKTRLYQCSASDGFPVKRFWTNSNPNPLGRLLAWNIYTAGSLLNLATVKRGDVVFLRTPPLQLGLTGYLAKKLRRTRILLSVQDIHPDLAIESGILKNRWAIKFAEALEKWVYRVSDAIVVISEGFRQNLLAKGVDSAKLTIIPNWVDTDFLKPLPKDNPVSKRNGLAGKFVVMYSGTISISSNRALERILETAGLLRTDPDILFAIVGEGLKKDELTGKAERMNLSNVVFLPFQPYADLPALLASSDVLLVPLDSEKSQMSVPSKLYNFMAAGRPILGLADRSSEVAGLIVGTRSGLCLPPDDIGAIARAVRSLRDSPGDRRTFGENARKYAVENYGKSVVLEKYADLISSLS